MVPAADWRSCRFKDSLRCSIYVYGIESNGTDEVWRRPDYTYGRSNMENPVQIDDHSTFCRGSNVPLGLVIAGALLFSLVYRFTTDEQWKEWRGRFIVLAMWISAIGFGLLHFRAFSVLNMQVLPFAVATILIPMAGGCAITYARVNLGFWWGVLLHCIINIPSVLMIAVSMI